MSDPKPATPAYASNWRPKVALLRWLCGAPLMNVQIALATKDKRAAVPILMRRSMAFFDTCQIDVTLSGNPPPIGKGCVICYNETSFADIFALSIVLLEHRDRGAMADVYKWIPFARAACRKLKIEMVPRGNRAQTEKLLSKVVTKVRQGERLAWGGEGRLSGHDAVGRFKVGASLIAIRAQCPIVPIAFYGGHQIWPLGSFDIKPGTIHVQFGTAIPTTGLNDDDARDLADRVQAEVAQIYNDLSQKHGPSS